MTRAECYHVTRRIAFARAVLHQGDPDRPTGTCTATFMRTGDDDRPAKKQDRKP